MGFFCRAGEGGCVMVMRRGPLLLAVLMVIGLIGCATPPVRLRHPQTGHTVQCGPYRRLVLGLPAMILENDCVNDFQKRGYERLPSEGGA